jgi:DNA-binding response OmpR family regulator
MRVLLIEDDPLLGEAVRGGLQQAGYAVDWVSDGRSGRTALRSHD